MKQEVINRFLGLYPSCLFIWPWQHLEFNTIMSAALLDTIFGLTLLS